MSTLQLSSAMLIRASTSSATSSMPAGLVTNGAMPALHKCSGLATHRTQLLLCLLLRPAETLCLCNIDTSPAMAVDDRPSIPYIPAVIRALELTVFVCTAWWILGPLNGLSFSPKQVCSCTCSVCTQAAQLWAVAVPYFSSSRLPAAGCKLQAAS